MGTTGWDEGVSWNGKPVGYQRVTLQPRLMGTGTGHMAHALRTLHER